MLVVETIGRVRREHFVKGKPIKEITRDLGILRNTVRKTLCSGQVSFAYERVVQPRLRLGRWKTDLERMLAVIRLGLPVSLRRSLAYTNIIENTMGTIRRVCRNVKHWRDASMALRWMAPAMQAAAKGFRRLKARKQLPLLRAAFAAHQARHAAEEPIEHHVSAA